MLEEWLALDERLLGADAFDRLGELTLDGDGARATVFCLVLPRAADLPPLPLDPLALFAGAALTTTPLADALGLTGVVRDGVCLASER